MYRTGALRVVASETIERLRDGGVSRKRPAKGDELRFGVGNAAEVAEGVRAAEGRFEIFRVGGEGGVDVGEGGVVVAGGGCARRAVAEEKRRAGRRVGERGGVEGGGGGG